MTPRQRLVAKIGAGTVTMVLPVVLLYEGTVHSTYKDPIGIVTVCTGHTGPELRMGQRYTKEQCETMLYDDLLKHADALNCIKTPLADNQKAAFQSFAFNVGNSAFCKSTLVRKANAGDLMGACAELSRWVMAGGRELPGLVKRRAAERQLCEKGLT